MTVTAKDVSARLASVERTVAKQGGVCAKCEKRVESLDKAIHGNSRDGLIARIAVVETRLNDINAVDQRANHARRLGVTGMVVAVLSGIGAAATYFFGR